MLKHAVFALLALTTSAHALAICGSDKVIKATSDRTDCLPKVVCKTMREVADRFGTVKIVSSYRPAADNAKRGGAKKSMHIQCRAVDFLVPGYDRRNTQQELANFLENKPGRYNVYCTGRTHFDDSNLKNGYSTCIRSSKYGKGQAPQKSKYKAKRVSKKYKKAPTKKRYKSSSKWPAKPSKYAPSYSY